MLLDVLTGREPRTFQGEPYEEIAVVCSLLLLAGLRIADRFEHDPRPVIGSIIGTVLVVFTLRMLVVIFKLRSYRLGGDPPRRPTKDEIEASLGHD